MPADGSVAGDISRSASVGQTAKMAHNPALDGLRGLAVLLVALFHARVPGFGAGYLGVDIFFVLSGYLITSLLLEEHRRRGSIRLGRFLWHRVLRLWPALWAFCLGMWLLSFWTWPSNTDPGTEILLTLLYQSDVSVALFRNPDVLSHSWSLAIEQHFYLVWPVALMLILRKGASGRLVRWIGLAFLVATVWRLMALELGQGWREVYYRLDTRLSGLMLGGFLAAVLATGASGVLRCRPLWMVLVPVAAVLVWSRAWGDPVSLMLGVILVELATLSLILATGDPASLPCRLLSFPPLRWLGLVSYGLYLWHYPIFRILRDSLDWPLVLAIGLPISVGLALISYLTIEAWGRRMRHGRGGSG